MGYFWFFYTARIFYRPTLCITVILSKMRVLGQKTRRGGRTPPPSLFRVKPRKKNNIFHFIDHRKVSRIPAWIRHGGSFEITFTVLLRHHGSPRMKILKILTIVRKRWSSKLFLFRFIVRFLLWNNIIGSVSNK